MSKEKFKIALFRVIANYDPKLTRDEMEHWIEKELQAMQDTGDGLLGFSIAEATGTLDKPHTVWLEGIVKYTPADIVKIPNSFRLLKQGAELAIEDEFYSTDLVEWIKKYVGKKIFIAIEEQPDDV